MLDDLKKSKKIIGMKQSLKALEKDIVQSVFIAKDADEAVVGNLKKICIQKAISINYIDNMKVLGKACGIQVGAAVVCLIKEDNA